MTRQTRKPKSVKNIKHGAARRRNIPTAEMEPVVEPEVKEPATMRYPRNTDLDPQLMWRGKDAADWSDLVVTAPPLYIQEKIHPKALIDDLLRQTNARADAGDAMGPDLFHQDFNGLLSLEAKTEFYGHDQNWTNRMILGDSLQVMASLAAKEDLAGRVQCIYFDPPYGIKFSSNWQVSTASRDVKDGKIEHVSREPEMIRAFRDTWRDGIHSYLTYLRDRLTVARDLLTDSGSIFVQIGDENVHRVRALMDEVFRPENFVGSIRFRKKTMPLGARFLEEMADYIIWYGKAKEATKYNQLFLEKDYSTDFHWQSFEDEFLTRHKISKSKSKQDPLPQNFRRFRLVSLWPASFDEKSVFDMDFRGGKWPPASGQCYPTSYERMCRLVKSNNLEVEGNFLRKIVYEDDAKFAKLTANWDDTIGARNKRFVVQTSEKVIQRCILMATDPGDLVLDPTCGSGTTATVAEQWGRRWITIDTSRVALALARARVMGAKYPYYLLADSANGRIKEAEITGKPMIDDIVPAEDIRQGFVYHRAPHITLKSIANNTEIDVIWDKWQAELEPLRQKLNDALSQQWEEWEIPREVETDWDETTCRTHNEYWQARIARQQEIDASIERNADVEFLYDRPYEDTSKIRVAGPFTVESLSPHRTLAVDVDGELVSDLKAEEGSLPAPGHVSEEVEFARVILDNLQSAGVQQMYKDQRIKFTGGITAHPGKFLCAVGRYIEGDPDDDTAPERRAGIFIGPEYGTVQRPELVAAGREAGDMEFDIVVACAFNYDPSATNTNAVGKIPIIKARINPDLHMAGDLKNTGAGNLFVVFGEPDIETITREDGDIQIRIHGVDIFNTKTHKAESAEADRIASWFIDTDYNEESFFVRHAYFLGGGTNDPYRQLKSSLKAEIDKEAWESLYSDVSRPFPRPERGRIAVKVIDHLGNEVMKVFEV